MSARTDLVTDPVLIEQLLQARRGQAYFSRQLEQLSDGDLAGPSLLPGWSRAHVAAHVGLNARALTRLTGWARTGVPAAMYDSPQQRGTEIDFSATLPARAIRHLSDHAAVHLTVEWRDLEPEQWSAEVVTATGRTVPVSETIWMRTREVWLHAVDLDNGGRVEDFPAPVVDRLLDDLVAVWGRAGVPGGSKLILAPLDRDRILSVGAGPSSASSTVVRGSAADLVAWGTGRAVTPRVTTGAGDPAPPAPRWL